MTTRCKFVCNEVRKRQSGVPEFPFVFDVSFSPVTDGSDENKEFFAWTPCGALTLTIKRDIFVPGREYYLNISEMEAG